MGGEFGREWIRVHIQLSPFAVHLKLSQRCLLIGYTLIQNKTFSKKIFKGLAFTCPCILSSSNPTEVLVQNQEYHSCTIPSPLGQQRPYNSSGFHSLAKKKNTYIMSSITLSITTGFPSQEYWSGLPFLFLGDLPDPGIEPESLALQADSLPTEPLGKPHCIWHGAEVPESPLFITRSQDAQSWCSSESPGGFKMLIPLSPQKLWPLLCRGVFPKSSPCDYSDGPAWEHCLKGKHLMTRS